MLIGRDNERRILQDALKSEYSQFIAVYGRRRVGKTFLIRESYDYKFAFQFTGTDKTPTRNQLARFRNTLKQSGLKDVPTLTTWIDAFYELERYLDTLPEGKKVVFFDELPWMDAPRSGFLSELESFWNGWASARKDIVLVVCGSATSWMLKKILKNKGGLHNRLTHRIALKPFPLMLCEKMAKSQGLSMSRMQILEAYMIFGGVPYYWSLLERGRSLTQEVDRLIFSEEGDLHDEFQMLYASLFRNPEPYVDVISALATKKMGMSREELSTALHVTSGGHFSEILEDLEWCGFIRKYTILGKKSRDSIYQLIDNFTLFYYEFIKDHDHADNYWRTMQGKPQYNTWCGLAFERVCLWHVDQIKKALGISGVMTNVYSWRCEPDKKQGRPGVQIDMLIDRNDGIIDLCEMKHSNKEYAITSEVADSLERKKAVFSEVTGTDKAVHTVMVTTKGIAPGEYEWTAQNYVKLHDLFAG